MNPPHRWVGDADPCRSTIINVLFIRFVVHDDRAINKLGSADRKMTLAESDSVVCPPACESQYLSATVRPKGSKYFIVSFQAVLLSLLTLLTRRNLY